MEIDISKLLPGEEGILNLPNSYFERGMEKKEMEVVKNMHKRGLSRDEIADFTGINLEKVKEIITNFSKQ